jgi:hypothetical protein
MERTPHLGMDEADPDYGLGEPAAEPPAPPAQVLTQTELNDTALLVARGKVTGNLNRITFSHEALRAEVIRLQASEKQLTINNRELEAEAQALRELLTLTVADRNRLFDKVSRLSPAQEHTK